MGSRNEWLRQGFWPTWRPGALEGLGMIYSIESSDEPLTPGGFFVAANYIK